MGNTNHNHENIEFLRIRWVLLKVHQRIFQISITSYEANLKRTTLYVDFTVQDKFPTTEELTHWGTSVSTPRSS